MGRHPQIALISVNAIVPRGHEGFWQIIREFDKKGPWSVPMIDGASIADNSSVRDYVFRLMRAGIAETAGTRPAKGNVNSPEKLYRLVRKPAKAPMLRRDGTELDTPVQQRMWNAIRALKQFTVRELAFAAGGIGGAIKATTVQSYVQNLKRVGYLSSPSHASYRLKPSMNTGPNAPKILRVHVVFDANRNEVIKEPGSTAVAEVIAS